MAGYYGHSMSNNAVRAYDAGLLPLSKAVPALATALKITRLAAREMLEHAGPSEWHHTSKRYNRTDFYDVSNIVRKHRLARIFARFYGENWLQRLQALRAKHGEIPAKRNADGTDPSAASIAELGYDEWARRWSAEQEKAKAAWSIEFAGSRAEFVKENWLDAA